MICGRKAKDNTIDRRMDGGVVVVEVWCGVVVAAGGSITERGSGRRPV